MYDSYIILELLNEGHVIFSLNQTKLHKKIYWRSGQKQVETELNLYRWKKVFIFRNFHCQTFEFIKHETECCQFQVSRVAYVLQVL